MYSASCTQSFKSHSTQKIGVGTLYFLLTFHKAILAELVAWIFEMAFVIARAPGLSHLIEISEHSIFTFNPALWDLILLESEHNAIVEIYPLCEQPFT